MLFKVYNLYFSMLMNGKANNLSKRTIKFFMLSEEDLQI